MSCNTSGYYLYYTLDSYTCTPHCLAGYYTESYECLTCDNQCYTCSGPSNKDCSSCSTKGSSPYYTYLQSTCT